MVVDGTCIVRQEDPSPAESETHKVRKDPHYIGEQIVCVAVNSRGLLNLDGTLSDREEEQKCKS